MDSDCRQAHNEAMKLRGVFEVFIDPPVLLPRPGKPSVAEKEQLGMAHFGFKFNMTPPKASDVTERELTITVNGQDPPQVVKYPGDRMQTDQLVFLDKDDLVLSLVDVDAAGNRSQPSAALTVKVIDDVPPPQPGELSIAEKVQVD